MEQHDGKRWVADEFSGMDLGDERLNKRAKTLMAELAAKPSASIPMACNGWSETLAAYRFLGNDKFDWREIMAPHWSRTEARMGGHPVVLCLQDTTELDFNGQDIAGLQWINGVSVIQWINGVSVINGSMGSVSLMDQWGQCH